MLSWKELVFNMKNILLISHLVFSVILIGLILLQNSQGGLQSGVGGEFYRSKRGAERIVFSGTIIVAILFFITSVASLLL